MGFRAHLAIVFRHHEMPCRIDHSPCDALCSLVLEVTVPIMMECVVIPSKHMVKPLQGLGFMV